MSADIHPVILCGGSGTRLWPMSRSLNPKQFLPLVTSATLLQETAVRLRGGRYAQPMFICNEEHRFVVAEQSRQADITPSEIVLEPVGRNTAPAAAVAALKLSDPEAMILLLPSDHVIGDLQEFHTAVEKAAQAARRGALVTFGIPPTAPHTGYGYILKGACLEGVEGCFSVERFVEKPDAETARTYLDAGGYLWNSGMFMFTAAAYLDELERLHSGMLAACRRAVAKGQKQPDFFRLSQAAYAEVPSLSIDYAIMERTDAAVVVPADLGWSDVGSWAALWELGDKDASGNVVSGDVIERQSGNCYLRSGGPLVAAIGLKDTVVVATADAVLVLAKDKAEEVKSITDFLISEQRPECASHLTVYRPWGSFRTLKVSDRFLIKHITLNPGARLSLQRHRHRAEHWVVVGGRAKITRGEETFELGEDQSTYIPIGIKHRLENPSADKLHIVEIQSGTTLDENDIERFEDVYGRV